MDDKVFKDLREKLTKDRFSLCDKKSIEYTRHSKNRLANFERIAEKYQVSREVVLAVYLEKHLDGIADYIKEGGKGDVSEPVIGRIADAQNYLDLLAAMVAEDA